MEGPGEPGKEHPRGLCRALEGNHSGRRLVVSAQQKGQSQRGIPAARMPAEKVMQEEEGWDQRLVSP